MGIFQKDQGPLALIELSLGEIPQVIRNHQTRVRQIKALRQHVGGEYLATESKIPILLNRFPFDFSAPPPAEQDVFSDGQNPLLEHRADCLS